MLVVSQEILDYYLKHSVKETFLYNNRLLFSRLISKQQYNVNHKYIVSLQNNLKS